MEDRGKENRNEGTDPGRLRRPLGPYALLFFVLLAILVLIWSVSGEPKRQEISHDFFVRQLEEGNIAEVVSASEFEKTGTFIRAPEAPATYEDGKLVVPTDKGGKPLVLSKRFRVRLDELISPKERERIDELLMNQDVRHWSRPRRDSTRFFVLSVPLLLILAIVLSVIWLWMLIDCLRNEPSEGHHRVFWVFVIILLNGLGALIYLIVRRPERVRRYGR